MATSSSFSTINSLKTLAVNELFISCASNLEPWLLEELKEMGIASTRRGHRGVYAPRTMENVYKINYTSRLATRVLWPLIRFPCPDRDVLYQAARTIEWERYFSAQDTLAIDANIDQHPQLRNSHFAGLVIKDAICDRLRDAKGWRPSVDLENPSLQLNLHIQKGIASLYIDTSGKPLFKRGYRQETGQAPLQESLAAAILKMADYQPERDCLCDPFCGSGTLLIEAAMMATNTPAGFFRRSWGFSKMAEFDETQWKAFRARTNEKRTPLLSGKIFGSDGSLSASAIARSHLEATGFLGSVDIFSRPIENLRSPFTPSLIISNPPYGKRLEANEALYRNLGKYASRCKKARLFFLASDEHMAQALELPYQEKIKCLNGGLPVKLYACH